MVVVVVVVGCGCVPQYGCGQGLSPQVISCGKLQYLYSG